MSDSYLFNATGHPTVIVPLGLNADGLPIAVQVVGACYSDPELLRFASLLGPIAPGFVKPKGF